MFIQSLKMKNPAWSLLDYEKILLSRVLA